MDHEWTTSLMTGVEGNPRVEERQLEAANRTSLENVNINLNSNAVANDNTFSHNSNLGDARQNSDQNAGYDDITSQVAETGVSSHPYNPSLFEPLHFPSSSSTSNTNGSSSTGAGFLSEDRDNRQGALDARRESCKRKNVEGVAGPSSANGSSGSFCHIENSSLNSHTARHNVATNINIFNSLASASDSRASEIQVNQNSGTITTGLAYDPNPSLNIAETAESLQRNLRRRFNPVHMHDIPPPYSRPSDNGSSHLSTWQLLNQPVPVNQLLHGFTLSQAPPHMSFVPSWPQNLHPTPRNRASNSRIRSTSGPSSSMERLAALREESNSNSTAVDGIPDNSLYARAADGRQVTQDPDSWNMAFGNMNMPGNVASTSRAGTNSGVRESVGSAQVSHDNSLLQRALSLSEVGNHQTPRRSALLMDRQNDGVPNIPLPWRSLAAREGRQRMVSEIRNTLEVMRRGESIQYENVFPLDHSALLGVADLHDRHRDMRLDVDNMSYEELLALGERIGDVNTGLSEETILKSLKHQKYLLSVAVEASEVEPCCICQEEYVEGEEVGTLDCGHDFHTACVKQWLMLKNLCPICKTTALIT